MNTFKKLLTTSFLGTITVALILAAAPASAEVVAAAGTLRAQGSGEIWAYGQGQMSFQLNGDGRLAIRHADQNQILTDGDGTKVVNGTTMTFYSYKGTITVTGTTIALYYTGSQANFQSYGNAKIILAGQGTYKVEDQDSVAWEDYGTTVTMGAPTISDDDQVWGDTAEYSAQTEAAVREIIVYPRYQEWAVLYPEAAVQLIHCHDYYSWCSTYPVAVAALYASPDWVIYIGGRPRLHTFIYYHYEYIVWYHDHPAFQAYFCHPVIYHRFVNHHHDAFVNISVTITYNDWSHRHPNSARDLERRSTVVRSNDTYIKKVAPRAEAMGAAGNESVLYTSAQQQLARKDGNAFKTDLNQDGVIDKSEKKAADDARKAYKNETDKADHTKGGPTPDEVRATLDTNKDGRVSQDEINNAKQTAKQSQLDQKEQKQADQEAARDQRQTDQQQQQVLKEQAKQQDQLDKQAARDQKQLDQQQDKLEKQADRDQKQLDQQQEKLQRQQDKADRQQVQQQQQIDKKAGKSGLIDPPPVPPVTPRSQVQQQSLPSQGGQSGAIDNSRQSNDRSSRQDDSADRVRQSTDRSSGGNTIQQDTKDTGRSSKAARQDSGDSRGVSSGSQAPGWQQGGGDNSFQSTDGNWQGSSSRDSGSRDSDSGARGGKHGR